MWSLGTWWTRTHGEPRLGAALCTHSASETRGPCSPQKKGPLLGGPQCGLCPGFTFHAFLAPDSGLAAWASLLFDLAGATRHRLLAPCATRGCTCVLKGFPCAVSLNLCLGLSASTPTKKQFGAGIFSKGVGLPWRYRQTECKVSENAAPLESKRQGLPWTQEGLWSH